jgi:anti-sigma regulatory factor (Ser/Thr protein kinase)
MLTLEFYLTDGLSKRHIQNRLVKAARMIGFYPEESLLRTLLGEALANSLKHGKPRSLGIKGIEVLATFLKTPEADYLILRDDGEGFIPPEDESFITQIPAEQLPQGGFGLGLMKNLLGEENFWLDSNKLGTTLIFKFPKPGCFSWSASWGQNLLGNEASNAWSTHLPDNTWKCSGYQGLTWGCCNGEDAITQSLSN